MTRRISIRNNSFILHATGALYWKEHRRLLISDVHLGKISHFRKHGSAVPHGVIGENFRKLDTVMSLFQPRELIFLGDLFHSRLNREWALFAGWVEQQKARISLVEGNHDILSPEKYASLGISVHEELQMEDFILTHEPRNREGLFNFSGHIHPGIKVQGKGRQSLSLPCFFRTRDCLILPAFGAFTGKYLLNPGPGDRVFIITPQEVIPFSPGRSK